jgi:hypothetical protein
LLAAARLKQCRKAGYRHHRGKSQYSGKPNIMVRMHQRKPRSQKYIHKKALGVLLKRRL